METHSHQALSDKVRVLHRHVVALLYHWIVSIDIGSWTNDWLGSCLVVNAGISLASEAFLARIEHNTCSLHLLWTRLTTHRFWASAVLRSWISVQAWSWHFQLQALSVEDLVVVESWWGGIETDPLSSNWLVVTGASLLLLPVGGFILNASDLVLNTENCFFIINMLALLALCNNLGSLASLRSKNADAGRRWMVILIEAIGCWLKDGITHIAFLFQSRLRLDSALWSAAWGFSNNH